MEFGLSLLGIGLTGIFCLIALSIAEQKIKIQILQLMVDRLTERCNKLEYRIDDIEWINKPFTEEEKALTDNASNTENTKEF